MRLSKAKFLVALVLLFAAPQYISAQVPIGSQFTYQGELLDGGSPANGAYDITFRLYGQFAGGLEVAPEEVFLAMPITDGQLTAELDFGFEAFSGDARWLEIVVDGLPLSPRQSVTASPYANYSSQTKGLDVDGDGNVGIGTESPERVLHTVGDAILVERDINDSGVLMRNNGNGQIQGMVGIRSTGQDEGFVFLTDEQQDIRLALSDGFVGVGRENPLSSEEAFGVNVSTPGANSFGGMYMNSSQIISRPFYGYAAGDIILARHYADGASGLWRLVNSSGEPQVTVGLNTGRFDAGLTDDGYSFCSTSSGNVHIGAIGNFDHRLNVMTGGYVGIGRETPTLVQALGQSWFDIDIPANGDQIGAMYLNNLNANARTQYGYASNGVSTATMEFDDQFDKWSLNIDNGSALAQLVVQSNGRVGISTESPDFLLHVQGSAGKPNGGPWSATSDRRLKKNIESLGGTLEKLLNLRGVTFEFKDPESIGELPGTHVGLIAQEVEKVFPEWVQERSDGYKSVAPYGFEALTVEALRELRGEKDEQLTKLQDEKNQQIAELQNENDELRERLVTLEAAVASLMAGQE